MQNSVFRSLEIIERQIAEKLTVEHIANSVYFSKYHYQRLFREIVGDSVMSYVNKRKLTLAGKMLLETEMTILEIALAFGFDSHEGFTRSFKAYMGVNPTHYRKYHLSAISQKIVKGEFLMYSKTTDEMIRELNDLIAKAKELANTVRKNEMPQYASFWAIIADTTDRLADKVNDVLNRIASIAQHPDEITTRFAIMGIMQDIAFQTNLLAFNVALMVSRGQPEHVKAQWPLREKYYAFAATAMMKTEKIAQFFNELSSLIFDDMRKAAAAKINDVIEKGHTAAESITDYENIRFEVKNLVGRISGIPLEDVTVSDFENAFFQLDIIAFAAEMDVSRNPADKDQFEGLAAFKNSIAEAIDFFASIIKPEAAPEKTQNIALQDIAFQGNILLFYTCCIVSRTFSYL